MALEATKKEWSELYTFFRLLAEGNVFLGTPKAKKDKEKCWNIAMIQREEHDGPRRYYIEGDNVRIEGEKVNMVLPREDFHMAASLILGALKQSKENDEHFQLVMEKFLDTISVFDLEAQTQDRTDLSIAFWHPEAPLVGFSVRSRLGAMNPLLDGGRTANLKLEQGGIKFATPTVNKINALPESPNEVMERILLIERLGGVLKYADVADRVFRCNLLMIDLHFPRLLAEMVRMMHLEEVTRVSELIDQMKISNPLKIKEELINKHGFYEHKMKQFLLALALGMRPAKIYNGTDSAVEGMLFVDGEGELLCYHKSEKNVFEDFLYLNSRFEKGSLDKDKYGFLERENGVYYFKLNAKIGLTKR